MLEEREKKEKEEFLEKKKEEQLVRESLRSEPHHPHRPNLSIQ